VNAYYVTMYCTQNTVDIIGIDIGNVNLMSTLLVFKRPLRHELFIYLLRESSHQLLYIEFCIITLVSLFKLLHAALTAVKIITTIKTRTLIYAFGTICLIIYIQQE